MSREIDLGSIIGPQGPKGDPGKDGSVDNIEVTDVLNLIGGGSDKKYTLQNFLNAVSKELKKDDKVVEVVFPASGWTSNGSPYVQSVTVDGITPDDYFVTAFVDNSPSASESIDRKNAYACITYFETFDNCIKATCKYKKPNVDFKVSFKGV